ncbi:probable cytochrome P450 6v1 [Musca vetustissima]|uniref:probable cytochrome P450 6v1 n=1 Tax=Musca vetustissima TaxID=27455 RepID=UPI002AB7CD33|nr:probable cytochrome P450 6v1 [Musca vetustissima]
MVDATTILLIVVTILTAVFVWSRRTYVYWQRRRVKFVRPHHLLGNLKDVIKMQNSFALQLRDYYFNERFVREPLVGIYLFHQPALLLRDLQVIRQVLVEDFVNFSHRFSKCDRHQDKMGALNLFFARNPEWRDIRTKMSPVFSTGKLRQMFSLMEEIGYDLETYLAKLTKDMKRNNSDGPIVQIKDICDLYNTDMIASIAFGLKSYSLRNTMRSQLGGHSREMFVISYRRAVDLCLIFIIPKLVKFLRPQLFTSEHTEFIRRLVIGVLEDRERNGILRNDLIETLLTFKKEAELNPDKSHFAHQQEYLVAQAAVFQLAGIQTSSSTLAFALYELARQPKLQERLHLEITATLGDLNGNELDYEHVERMTYLGMVVDETLRKYPIVPFLERECTPLNRKRFVSFRPNAECMARRGMPVYISNLALHYDPQYWPEPELFDPERFSPEQKKSHKPMTYLPFGAGPHQCIAQPFALLQVKLGLIHFLKHHRVECCDKTVNSIKFDKRYALLTQEGGIYLKLVEI